MFIVPQRSLRTSRTGSWVTVCVVDLKNAFSHWNSFEFHWKSTSKSPWFTSSSIQKKLPDLKSPYFTGVPKRSKPIQNSIFRPLGARKLVCSDISLQSACAHGHRVSLLLNGTPLIRLKSANFCAAKAILEILEFT